MTFTERALRSFLSFAAVSISVTTVAFAQSKAPAQASTNQVMVALGGAKTALLDYKAQLDSKQINDSAVDILPVNDALAFIAKLEDGSFPLVATPLTTIAFDLDDASRNLLASSLQRMVLALSACAESKSADAISETVTTAMAQTALSQRLVAASRALSDAAAPFLLAEDKVAMKASN